LFHLRTRLVVAHAQPLPDGVSIEVEERAEEQYVECDPSSVVENHFLLCIYTPNEADYILVRFDEGPVDAVDDV
jgi:hypothetical protein